MNTHTTHPTNSPAAGANPKLIDTAAGVIKAAMAQGNREAYSLAFTLDAAGLLQSPETAAKCEAIAGQRLTEILARANAATPGPWCTDAWEIYQGTEYVPGISWWIGETCRGTSTPEQDRADASFVAAARTDVPELVAEVVALRARVAELEAEQEKLIRWHREDGAALTKAERAVNLLADSHRRAEQAEARVAELETGNAELHALIARLGARAEQRHLMDPLDHVLEHLADAAEVTAL